MNSVCRFSVKEVDMGLAADVGTLQVANNQFFNFLSISHAHTHAIVQRLPRVVNSHSWVREIVFTSRRFDAQEAKVHFSSLRLNYTHSEIFHSLLGTHYRSLSQLALPVAFLKL